MYLFILWFRGGSKNDYNLVHQISKYVSDYNNINETNEHTCYVCVSDVQQSLFGEQFWYMELK